MKSFGNPAAVNTQTFINRKSEGRSGLNDGGKLTRQANVIIPRRIFGDYDPKRIEILKDDLNALIPDYVVKTGIEDYDVDKIMENARKRYEKEKVWKKWNNFDDIPGIEKGYIETATEEEFRAQIELYVKHVKGLVNKNVSVLKDAIISAIKTNSPIKTSAYDPKRDSTVNHLLKEFLNDEWDIVDTIPEALAMGLIIMKNTVTGNVNILSLTVNQFYADSNLEDTNYGDLEILKSFLFVNMFKNTLFPQGHGKLSQILVFNPENNTIYPRNTFSKFSAFKERMYAAGLKEKLRLTENDISGIEDIAMYNLDACFRKFNGAEKKDINEIFSLFRETNFDDIDVEQLMDIQKAFYAKYGDYRDKTAKGTVNFEDPKEVLLALLQVALVSKNQMSLEGDFQKLSKLSLGFSDFRSLISVLYTDNQAKYNSEGKRIQGIVQGLLWTTPD